MTDKGDLAQAEPEPAVLGIEQGQALDAADNHLERNAIRINEQAHRRPLEDDLLD